MKSDMRNKALKQLALTKGEAVEEALKKELRRIEAVLETETLHSVLDEQLAILKEIAFRFPNESIAVIETFLDRLVKLELTYESDSLALVEGYREYYDNDSLVKKTVEVVERIRYHVPRKALKIFLEYSLSENESIKRQAEQSLKYIARYDLDVFWGDGKEFRGLGAAPQKALIEEIQSFSEIEKEKFLLPIKEILHELLSPTMEGSSWNYRMITFKTGSIPALESIKEVRSHSLSILMELYGLAKDIDQKGAIIGSMQQATRPPMGQKTPDGVLDMISDNTVAVLDFYRSLINNEDLQIVQKVEHDAFWICFHSLSENVERSALAVKAEIDSHTEYQIFKVLIGFEGVFEEWRKKSDGGFDEGKFTRIEEMRTQKAKEYAESITQASFPEWSKRILTYGQIKSNDLATFPHFAEFLEFFAKYSPDLALELLRSQNDALQWCVIPLLKGGWYSDQRDSFEALISEWTNHRKHLPYISRFLENIDEPNVPLLEKIFSVASETQDRNLLAHIISVVVKHYEAGKPALVQSLFVPAIRKLTELEESGWIFGAWYRNQLKGVLSELSVEECQIVLNSLVHLNVIAYHAEGVLYPIAEKHPAMVFEFFGKRLAQTEARETFEAVPYSFHKLSQPLSKVPQKAVEIVRSWYDKSNNISLFMYREARLLKISFPDFPSEFADALVELVRTGEEQDILFVLFVLRNYEGQIFLHEVCKEIVRTLPSDSPYLAEVMIILEDAGVVSGDYGFVEAYTRKKSEVQEWLNEENEKVQKFVEDYVHHLDQMIDSENQRVKERVALGKYEWGEGEDTES